MIGYPKRAFMPHLNRAMLFCLLTVSNIACAKPSQLCYYYVSMFNVSFGVPVEYKIESIASTSNKCFKLSFSRDPKFFGEEIVSNMTYFSCKADGPDLTNGEKFSVYGRSSKYGFDIKSYKYVNENSKLRGREFSTLQKEGALLFVYGEKREGFLTDLIEKNKELSEFD